MAAGKKRASTARKRTVRKAAGVAPDVKAVIAAARAAGFVVPAGALPVFLPKSVARFLGLLEEALISGVPGKGMQLKADAVDALVEAVGGSNAAAFRRALQDAYVDWQRCRPLPFFIG